MDPVEKPAVTPEPEPVPAPTPDAPAAPAPVSTANVPSLSDLIRRDMPNIPGKISPAKPPVPGAPESQPQDAQPDAEKPATPGVSEPEPEPELGKDVKLKTRKAFERLRESDREKLDAANAALEKTQKEYEALKLQTLQRLQQSQPQPQRPMEKTPEYWGQKYYELRQAGVDELDPRVQSVLKLHEQYKTEALADQMEQRQVQRETLQRERGVFVRSLFDVHESHPFLIKAENAIGFDLDPESPLTQTMVRMATEDGIGLANNPVAILHYAQRADRVLLRQRLTGSAETAENLKRERAEAAAKGLIPGTRPAPPAPKSEDKKLDELEAQAWKGKGIAKRQLAAAALSKDLGL